jgi:hypothetical protein
VVLFGVEPHTISLGMRLSDTVRRALPELCDRVVAELRACAPGGG